MSIFCKLHTLFYLIKKEIYILKEKRGSLNSLKLCSSSISHVSYFVIGNVGDTALSHCIRKFYEKYNDKTNWNLIRVNADVTSKTISKINRTKALIIGGGGLFLPDTNTNKKSGWQWNISPELLSQIKVPIYIYSVGYNYFPGQQPSSLFEDNLVMLCQRATFIGLRNTGSIQSVRKILPEELRAKIVYQPCTTTLIRKIFNNILPPKIVNRKVAFNLAFDREERRFGKSKEEICNAIAAAAKLIHSRGYDIILVYHVETDKLAKIYFDKLCFPYTEKDLTTTFPLEIYNFYNQIEFTIGMRGHAQMIPFGVNGKILSLISHNKMSWFLEDINAPDWQINLLEKHTNLSLEIYEKFILIQEKEHTATVNRLLEAQERLWKISMENLSLITNLSGQ